MNTLGSSPPFICAAAGNDSGAGSLGGVDVDAMWAGGWQNAALRGLVDNILVVEAVGAPSFTNVQPSQLRRSSFSDINGQISARANRS